MTKIMLKEYSVGTLEQIGEVEDVEVLAVEAQDSGGMSMAMLAIGELMKSNLCVRIMVGRNPESTA